MVLAYAIENIAYWISEGDHLVYTLSALVAGLFIAALMKNRLKREKDYGCYEDYIDNN